MWIAPVLRPRTEPLLIQVQVWAARMAFFDPDLSVVAGRRAFSPTLALTSKPSSALLRQAVGHSIPLAIASYVKISREGGLSLRAVPAWHTLCCGKNWGRAKFRFEQSVQGPAR